MNFEFKSLEWIFHEPFEDGITEEICEKNYITVNNSPELLLKSSQVKKVLNFFQ